MVYRSLIAVLLLLLLPSLVQAQVAMRPGTTRIAGNPPGSGNTDTATAADYLGWIAWDSGAASNKSQVLPKCGPDNSGMWIGVIDKRGNAVDWPIQVTATASNVGGTAGGVMISAPHGSVVFACDGQAPVGNWMVTSQVAGGPAVRPVIGMTDMIKSSDNGGLVTYTQPAHVDLPVVTGPGGAFPGNGFSFAVRNYSNNTMVITPIPPSTIDNGKIEVDIASGLGAFIFANGSGNYDVILSGGGGGGGGPVVPPGWSGFDDTPGTMGPGITISQTDHPRDTATRALGGSWSMVRGTRGYVIGGIQKRVFTIKYVSAAVGTLLGRGWIGGINTLTESLNSYVGSSAGAGVQGVGLQASGGTSRYVNGIQTSLPVVIVSHDQNPTLWMVVDFENATFQYANHCGGWTTPFAIPTPGTYYPAWAGLNDGDGVVNTVAQIDTNPDLTGCIGIPGYKPWDAAD